MLTLQMIRLMENLWKKEGLDLRYSRGSTVSVGLPLNRPNSVLVTLRAG